MIKWQNRHLDSFASQQRQQEVEQYCPRKACQSVEYHEYHGCNYNYIAAEVFAEIEVLEFKGEHFEASYHGQRQQYYENHHHSCARIAVAAYPAIHSNPENGIRRYREAFERCGLFCVVVEFCQAERSAHRYEEGRKA